jgi:hypothetical protein
MESFPSLTDKEWDNLWTDILLNTFTDNIFLDQTGGGPSDPTVPTNINTLPLANSAGSMQDSLVLQLQTKLDIEQHE